MAFTGGVYPVFDLVFKIDTTSRGTTPTFVDIKDVETFEPSIDGEVKEWTPMDQEGWARRLLTAKKFGLKLSGKRQVGDPGNDYVAGLAFLTGLACNSKMEITFPDGDKLTFDCVVNVSKPFGGASADVSTLDFDVLSDGKPTYTPAI